MSAQDRFEDYMTKRQDSLLEQAKGLTAQVIAIFEANGIAEAHVHYEGGGDSGDWHMGNYIMDDGTVRSPDEHYYGDNEKHEKLSIILQNQPFVSESYDSEKEEWVKEEALRDIPLDELMEEIAHIFVSLWHGGWENNDGGRGEVTISRTSVGVDHEEYYQSSNSYNHSVAIPSCEVQRRTWNESE